MLKRCSSWKYLDMGDFQQEGGKKKWGDVYGYLKKDKESFKKKGTRE